jgi:hypothetical protein
MRPSRTWQTILDGSRNVRFADFERLLQAFGFVLDRKTAVIGFGCIRVRAPG